jgi:hypothetical protein
MVGFVLPNYNPKIITYLDSTYACRWQADISLLRGKTRNVRTRYLMPLAFAAIATTTLPDRYTSGGASERIPGEAAERGWGNQ